MSHYNWRIRHRPPANRLAGGSPGRLLGLFITAVIAAVGAGTAFADHIPGHDNQDPTFPMPIPGADIFNGGLLWVTLIAPDEGTIITNTTYHITFVSDGATPASELLIELGVKVGDGIAEFTVIGADLGFGSGPGVFHGKLTTDAFNGETWQPPALPFSTADLFIAATTGGINGSGYFVDSFVMFDVIPVQDPDTLVIESSDPPDNAIDARQPSEPDGSMPAGIDSVSLTFTGNAAPISDPDFLITTDPPGAAPVIEEMVVDGNTITLHFDAAIPLNAWTNIEYTPSGSSVRIGSLPGDVIGDGISNANDVLSLIDHLNGVVEPLADYQTDVDRSGITNSSDVLRVIDLLNGAGVYDVYFGATLPD